MCLSSKWREGVAFVEVSVRRLVKKEVYINIVLKITYSLVGNILIQTVIING